MRRFLAANAIWCFLEFLTEYLASAYLSFPDGERVAKLCYLVMSVLGNHLVPLLTRTSSV
jgi:hypothetical protein